MTLPFARAHETLLLQALEHLAVETLLGAHDGRAQHRALARELRHQRLDDLARVRRADFLAAHMHGLRLSLSAFFRVPAGGRAASRVQQAQVVPDLGRRRNDRARTVTARALLDRDRRRKPVDRLDVRLLHLVEELPRVRRQRLHVFALAFGEDGVERQRALARARHAGDHHQLVARDLDREVLQVVLAGAANADGLLGRCHGGSGDHRGSGLRRTAVENGGVSLRFMRLQQRAA